jgi:hypothetical protein
VWYCAEVAANRLQNIYQLSLKMEKKVTAAAAAAIAAEPCNAPEAHNS